VQPIYTYKTAAIPHGFAASNDGALADTILLKRPGSGQRYTPHELDERKPRSSGIRENSDRPLLYICHRLQMGRNSRDYAARRIVSRDARSATSVPLIGSNDTCASPVCRSARMIDFS
jgi:hypothetical protein